VEHNFSFPTQEKLKHRKAIEALFSEGKTIHFFPVRVVFVLGQSESDLCLQVAFSVSKKKFKRAVDRNRVKRLMREAYRLNANILRSSLDGHQIICRAMFIFTGAELPNIDFVESAMVEVLNGMAAKIRKLHA